MEPIVQIDSPSLVFLAIEEPGQEGPGRLEVSPGLAGRLPPLLPSSPGIARVFKPHKQVLVSRIGSSLVCKTFAQSEPPSSKILLQAEAGAGSPVLLPPGAGDGGHSSLLDPGQQTWNKRTPRTPRSSIFF